MLTSSPLQTLFKSLILLPLLILYKNKVINDLRCKKKKKKDKVVVYFVTWPSNVIYPCYWCRARLRSMSIQYMFSPLLSSNEAYYSSQGRYSPIISIIPNLLHHISGADQPIIPNYWLATSLFIFWHTQVCPVKSLLRLLWVCWWK